MKKFFNFLPTKGEEDSRGSRKRGEVVPSTDVEIREIGPGTRTAHYIDPWTIRKMITHTDLNRNGKLLVSQEGKGPQAIEENILRYLPSNVVENVLAGTQQVIRIKDVDEGTYHDDMTLVRKLNTNLFYIQGHWIRDFVVRRRLQPGQVVGLCWNVAENCLDFSVLKPLGAK